MTDRKYLKIMIAYGEELDRLNSADPVDQASIHNLFNSMARTNRCWWRNRRRRPWYMIFLICFLLYCLAWIFWSILF